MLQLDAAHFGVGQLRFDIQRIGSQRNLLRDAAADDAIELAQQHERSIVGAQRALRLNDVVVETLEIADQRQLAVAELLDLARLRRFLKLDVEVDLEQRRQRLRRLHRSQERQLGRRGHRGVGRRHRTDAVEGSECAARKRQVHRLQQLRRLRFHLELRQAVGLRARQVVGGFFDLQRGIRQRFVVGQGDPDRLLERQDPGVLCVRGSDGQNQRDDGVSRFSHAGT